MKNNDSSVPVVIGVTGHRDLKTEDIPALKSAVRTAISQVRGMCPSSPLLMLTSLAEGADQLCARTALECGVDIITVLPMPREEYEKDFRGDALEGFNELCGRSEKVFEAPRTEEFREIREYSYRQAGIYVAEHCHVLLALWDGIPDNGFGCGTAWTVSVKLDGLQHASAYGNLCTDNGAVMQIVTPRANRTAGQNGPAGQNNPAGQNGPAEPEEPFTTKRLGDWDCLANALSKTDIYNREAAELITENRKESQGGRPQEPGKAESPVYRTSDELSVKYAVKHRHTLAAISAAATIVTIAFLLYDEASLYWMILVCGAMLFALYCISRQARRSECHRKYLDYRLLAECLRVQAFIDRSGSHAEITELLPWSWQMDLPWIKHAVAALSIGRRPSGKQQVREVWMEDQKNYHLSALRKSEEKQARNNRTVKVCLIISIAAYVAALVFEIACGGLFSADPSLPADKLELFRTILKIVLGSLSAATLFAGNYYGKLSVEQTAEDHRYMAELYSAAEKQALRSGETEDLLLKLAREELCENSRWYTYQSLNSPDMSL